MPLLSDEQVRELRQRQIEQMEHCQHCAAQVWPNYCRTHDEWFTDGHYSTCPHWSAHSRCSRRY